jgi:hypothetical protein
MNTMQPALVPTSNWLTAGEITARYVVGAQKLAAYSLQGNLPLRRGPDGVERFDEKMVALLFRPRQGASMGLGVLGEARLGQPAPDENEPPASSRQARRLGPRVVRDEWSCVEGQRKAG